MKTPKRSYKKYIYIYLFSQHKYQINIDGTVAAYRFPYLLAGDALVLKQDSSYYEHFYSELKPKQHYLPFKQDLSDLLEKIQWAKDNNAEVGFLSLLLHIYFILYLIIITNRNFDFQARKMAQAGQQYVRDNLLGKDIFCYHAVLFKVSGVTIGKHY